MAIWAWLGAMAGASRIPALRRTGYAARFRDPATADLAQFATGVLPSALYLATGEAGRGHATRGKRAAALTIVDSDGRPPHHARIAVRTAVKLLPWQIAHLSITRAVGIVPGKHSKKLALTGFGISLGLVACSTWLAITRPDGKALHDLVAGTQVTPVETGQRLPVDEVSVS